MIIRISSRAFTQSRTKYITFKQNQLLIIEALLEHGGNTKRYKDRKGNLRFSEHFGMVDFDNKGVDRIIVSGQSFREDDDDVDILLPNDPADIVDFEYFIHTHPPTPKPGGRAPNGILYEFPSISDIFVFIDAYNHGKTQGSLVAAPEGMYVLHSNEKKIKYGDEDKIERYFLKHKYAIDLASIEKHGTDFNDETFYGTIAQDTTFAEQFKKLIQKCFKDQIEFFYIPRKRNETSGDYHYAEFKLPVKVVEPLSKKK